MDRIKLIAAVIITALILAAIVGIARLSEKTYGLLFLVVVVIGMIAIVYNCL